MAISSVKNRLGEFFRSRLDAETEVNLKFFLNNSDQDTGPPYGIIRVTKLQETVPFSTVFYFELTISLISSIDQSTSDQHDLWLQEIMGILNHIPRRVLDTPDEIKLLGWFIAQNQPIIKEESQSYTDEILLKGGCQG